ncbi:MULTISPECIES: hypothetical protein [Mycobacterium]|uniref:hypothetical protein n=1 Tax=Mycobacterium TaxID=1763 RepID=UPI000AD96941|nr:MULTISPECIES: hypothetical protein [Mycobacterium]MCG7610497.1 hypothetical protein [Mycobacterium sp. CnD-18-1]
MVEWKRTLSALLASGVVVSCAPSVSPDVRQSPSAETPNAGQPPSRQTQTVNWPDKLKDFRFRWSAEPGIDLYSGAAVPLRAYAESWRVAQMMSDMSAAYPGFERAVPANRELTDHSPRDAPAYMLTFVRPSMDDELDEIYTDKPRYESKRFYGNEYFHILSLDEVDGGWRAYLCDGLYDMYRDGKDGYSPVTSLRGWTGPPKEPMKGIRVWHVEMAAPENSGASAPQKGSNPAPSGDVFSSWRIRGAAPDSKWESAPGFSGSDYHETFADFERRRQQCSDRMPGALDSRNAGDQTINKKPDMQPAVPGWPDATT